MADGIVGIAYVELRPLMTDFGAAAEEELGASGAGASDLEKVGQDAGAALGTGIGAGANDALGKTKLSGLLGPDGRPLASSLQAVGEDAGAALGAGLGTGVKGASDDIAEELKKGALFNLPALSPALEKFASDAQPEAEAAGFGISEFFAKGFEKIAGTLESAELPFAATFSNAAKKLSAAKVEATDTASAFSGLSKTSVIAGVAIAAGVGYESVKLAQNFQQAQYQIAATGDISQAAAGKITTAFQSTAFTTYASSTEISEAYGKVVGQLGSVQGKALSASQALGFMRTSLDLNEAVSGNLTTTTQDLAQVMQSFNSSLNQTSHTSDVLFNTSRLTDTSLSSVTTTVDKLHGRLAATGISLGDISSLMVELAKNGASGGRSTQLVSTAFTKLLSGSTAVKEQLAALGSGKTLTGLKDQLDNVNAALDKASTGGTAQSAALKSQIANLKSEISNFGVVTSSNPAYLEVKTLKNNLSQLEDQLGQTTASQDSNTVSLKNQKAALEAEILASNKGGVSLFNAKGQFVGTKQAISELHDAFRNLTQQQQLQAAQTLFGTSAAQTMIKIIQEGPAAFDKWSKQINAAGSAAQAAAKNNKTLDKEAETLKSGVEDSATSLGLKLIPALQTALPWIAKIAGAMATAATDALNLGTNLDKLINKQLKSSTGSGEPSHITDALQALGFNVGTGTTGPTTKTTAAYIASHLTKAQRSSLDAGANVAQFETDLRAGGARSQAFVNAAEQQVAINARAAKLLTPADSRKPTPVPRAPLRAGAKPVSLSTYLDGQKIAHSTSKKTAAKVTR